MEEHPDDPVVVQYFVDEAGDPALFDSRGRILLGHEGCSSYFILGKLDIEDPAVLSTELSQLRTSLIKNPYFKGVPSMNPTAGKTALAFHAKDDVPEVRWEVFKLLMNHEVRFHAVIRDKQELLSHAKQQRKKDPKFRYKPDGLYDYLVKELFKGGWYKGDHFTITFAERGNKGRTGALKNALDEASKEFEQGFGFSNKAEVMIISSSPPKTPGLQAVDYFLWALQRFYERREDRFLELIWPKVAEIHDLDYVEAGRKGVFFRKGKPLTLENRKND